MKRTQAFSLLELLVVIAIIIVVLAILLPAAMSVRESANKASCGNNLRQQGVALHAYHDAHRRFPPAIMEPSGWRGSGHYVEGRKHTGFTLLLPYLEHDSVYQEYDFNYPSCNARPEPSMAGVPNGGITPDHPNARVVRTYISTYHCPSDAFPGIDDYDFKHHIMLSFGQPFPMDEYLLSCTTARRSNYLFMTGKSSQPNAETPPTGMFTHGRMISTIYDHVCRRGDVRDGLSHTIAIGETRQDHIWLDAFAIHSNQLCRPHWGAGHINAVNGSAQWSINYPAGLHFWAGLEPLDRNYRLQVSNGFGSWHRQGANFVFGDGSVRFLRDRLQLPVFQALATMRGGEAIPGHVLD